jgi:hypothetical protein
MPLPNASTTALGISFRLLAVGFCALPARRELRVADRPTVATGAEIPILYIADVVTIQRGEESP